MVQTQHAIASQNWQRIEGSLQLRTEALEKERNDLTKRLDEEKRKVKEAVIPPFTLSLSYSPLVACPLCGDQVNDRLMGNGISRVN